MNTTATTLHSEKNFYGTLLKIALPVALQSLISLGVVMLDNIMVGSLGETALSAVSLANQVTVFFTFIIKGISGGASILISQYWGKKDMERIKTVFGIIFQISATIGLATTIFVFFRPETTMRIFTNNYDIIHEAISYIKIISFTYMLFTVSETFIAMLRCVEVVKLTLWNSILSFFMNLILNYILIFGKLGFPALGVVGAAIATLIARFVEFMIVYMYTFRIQKVVSLRLRDLFRTDKLMLKDFCRYGLPIIVGDVQWGLVGVFKATIIGRLGVSMVAANSITEVVLSLGSIFTTGLANAACIVIGKTIGERDYVKTRRYSNKIQILFVIVGVLMSSLVFLTRSIFVSFYNIEAATKALTVQLIAIGAITLIGTSYHAACFVGINRGGGDSRFVFMVDLIFGWLVVLPLSYLAAFVWKLPLPMVFLFIRIDQLIKWLIAFLRLRGDKWIHNVTRE